ncbi:MAG: hypothetical protein ACERKT_08490 [Acidobacteriota bacterium]
MSPGLRNAVMLAPAVGVITLLFGGALAGAFQQSVTPALGGGIESWSLASWRELFGDPVFGDALAFSLRTTVLATAISAALAVPIARALHHRGGLSRTFVALPVPVPHLLVAVTAVLWLAPGGIADRALGALPLALVRDPSGLGVVLVYLYKEIPFLVLLLLAAMGRDLDRREEMAAVLGVGVWGRLRLVVWPAVRSPLAVGSLIVAAFVFGAFEVPLAVGPNYPPAVATYAWESTQGDALTGAGRSAAALLVTAAASMAIALAVTRFSRGAAAADG